MGALSGKVGAVHLPTSAVPIAGVALATTADASKTRYTITDATKRYLDPASAVTVKKNGVTQSSGYKIEHAGGVVVFDVALTTEVITVDASYFTVAEAGGFFNWSVELNADLEEETTFASNGWKEYRPTLKGWSASAEMYWQNGDQHTRIVAGKSIVLILYVNDTAGQLQRYEGYAQLAADSVTAEASGLVQENIDFVGDGPLFYRAG